MIRTRLYLYTNKEIKTLLVKTYLSLGIRDKSAALIRDLQDEGALSGSELLSLSRMQAYGYLYSRDYKAANTQFCQILDSPFMDDQEKSRVRELLARIPDLQQQTEAAREEPSNGKLSR